MPGILSPDVQNLVIGKGFALFHPDGGSLTLLGNCPKVSYTPKVTMLPHFTEMQGTKIQDFTAIQQIEGSLSIDMEERTAFNLSLFFMGDIDNTDPTKPLIDIYSKAAAIQGAFHFYATNAVGPRWFMILNRVIINPTSAFEPISDGWGAMTIAANHVVDDNGLWGTIQLNPPANTLAPFNVLPPFITGPLNIGEIPAFAKVGEVMTASVGAWIGSTGYAYQWYANAVLIGGATSKTYTPVIADVGKPLTVQVTATNIIGSTIQLSGPTQNVHA